MIQPSKKQGAAIKRLRGIIGKTQIQFAAMIGASKETVTSWEVGRNPISNMMAQRIRHAAGTSDKHLLRGQLRTVLGCKDYTVEWFHAWQRRFTEKALRAKAADTISVMLSAAAMAGKAGRKDRLPGLYFAFVEWADKAVEDFGLAPEINQWLKAHRSYDEDGVTWWPVWAGASCNLKRDDREVT